ncbi:DUF6843 domain-containing protein [Hymenobacter rubidus]|uniref:DUF6843 domain-containing protein n=1 Tax=Hymenobacter rubidus TaxID=1441626 RepID=UPI00191F39DF|nr:hypothetical protein [Hymenobacter rubidus]
MNRSVGVQAAGMLLNITGSLAIVMGFLARQNWFGSGDTEAFLYWTAPLVAGVAAISPLILRILPSFPVGLRALLLVVIAAGIAFGWVYGVALLLGPWMGAFSFPVLYPWVGGTAAQLLLLERFLPEANRSRRVLTVLFTGFLALAGTGALLIGLSWTVDYLNRPAKETYLIPDDFSGEFRVVYGESCGLTPPTENGRRILTLPRNGVLILQPPFVAGLVDNEYYWVDKRGKRKRAREIFATPGSNPGRAGVALTASGSMSAPVAAGATSAAGPDIHFSYFTVFTNDTTVVSESESSRRQRRLDSLTLTLVNECRSRRP